MSDLSKFTIYDHINIVDFIVHTDIGSSDILGIINANILTYQRLEDHFFSLFVDFMYLNALLGLEDRAFWSISKPIVRQALFKTNVDLVSLTKLLYIYPREGNRGRRFQDFLE